MWLPLRVTLNCPRARAALPMTSPFKPRGRVWLACPGNNRAGRYAVFLASECRPKPLAGLGVVGATFAQPGVGSAWRDEAGAQRQHCSYCPSCAGSKPRAMPESQQGERDQATAGKNEYRRCVPSQFAHRTPEASSQVCAPQKTFVHGLTVRARAAWNNRRSVDAAFHARVRTPGAYDCYR